MVDMQDGFLEAYQKLSAEGVIHVFDTGWEEDLSIEKYRDYLEIADYYVPNQKEALKITGESTVENAARQLSRYFKDVIIKLDKDGCLLQNSDGIKIIPPLPGVTAVDATGAGDAFWGGFLSSLRFQGVEKPGDVTEEKLQKALRYGNAAGGLCVQKKGAIAALPTKEQVEANLAAGIC